MTVGEPPAFAGLDALCWRAVLVGQERTALDGTTRAGRYNRPGVRTLYMSSSPEGVAAAMARYRDVPRSLLGLRVAANRLVDLRNATACAALGIDPARGKVDWIAALDRNEAPPSWAVADRARALGAAGLIDPSRRAPGAWHLVLFRWNEPGEAAVSIAE